LAQFVSAIDSPARAPEIGCVIRQLPISEQLENDHQNMPSSCQTLATFRRQIRAIFKKS
jgi:hypothetical protein